MVFIFIFVEGEKQEKMLLNFCPPRQLEGADVG